MKENKFLAVALSLLLVTLLTTAALGKTSWLLFWLVALALFAYVTYTKKP